jgi:hypothetical protein
MLKCRAGTISLLLLLGASSVSRSQSLDLPAGPIQAKVRTACTECHDASIIRQQRLGERAWTKELDKMIKWGALVGPAERAAFIEYLSVSFPPDKPPSPAVRVAQRQPQ